MTDNEAKRQHDLDLIFSEKPVKQKKFFHIHKFEYQGEDNNHEYFECSCGRKKSKLISNK